jgi:hypothetical protein
MYIHKKKAVVPQTFTSDPGPEGLRKTTKNVIGGLRAEILTWDPPHMNQNYCPLSSLDMTRLHLTVSYEYTYAMTIYKITS